MSHIIGEIRSDLLRTRFARTLTRRTVGLGFVAGFVNTVGFFDPHVYPGIMTGNTVQLGMALAQSDRHLFRLIALTIALFLGGGIAGSLIRRHLKRPPLELIVTAVLPLDATPFRTKTSNTIPVELGLLAVTMAIQGETVSRIGTVPIQIVVVTNNLVHSQTNSWDDSFRVSQPQRYGVLTLCRMLQRSRFLDAPGPAM